MRFAFGGIHIECSTYSRISTLTEDFTVLSGDLSDFTCLELHIPGFKLLVVKSGYLSPELAPLANPNLMALSDGSILQDLDKLPKNKLRPPTFPFDRSFRWQPSTIVSARSPRETR